jgi:hypothetical protein
MDGLWKAPSAFATVGLEGIRSACVASLRNGALVLLYLAYIVYDASSMEYFVCTASFDAPSTICGAS